MMSHVKQTFGGDWTADKLVRIRKYLVAYAIIMGKYNFPYAYIDAFAGTGYNQQKGGGQDDAPTLAAFADAQSQEFLDGSARLALSVQPRFTKYIFVERDAERFGELGKLKEEFPSLRGDIILVNEDANTYLQHICQNTDWSTRRAVLFLDPFGMQVEWNTIEAIAGTQAIDLWILFPLGVAVNRLLRRDAAICPAWRAKLDRFFGATDWFEAFYQPTVTQSLFGEEPGMEKVGTFAAIEQYFVRRLQTVFPAVADNPLALYNSQRCPLYLLCFACGNSRASDTAIRIAQHILGH